MGKTLLDYQTEWEKLVDKGFTDYFSLSAAERTWFNIQSFTNLVENGGLISYYYNSGADWCKDTIQDLNSLGLSDIAGCLIQINKLFPNMEPPTDLEERNEIISNWPEGKYDNLFDKLDQKFFAALPKLEQVLLSHIQTIPGTK